MAMSSAQKVAVVVGVGPGLGGHVARRFAKEGFAVALLSRTKAKLSPVEDAIKQEGGRAISIQCDAGQHSDVEAAFASIRQQLGNPSVLIYNAGPSIGSWPPPGILDVTPESFNQCLAIGVSGALYCAQQVIPNMLEAKQGTILITGATASLRGGAKFAQLAVPKFALRGLAQSIAREFHPQGIHVAHVIIDGQIALDRTVAMFPNRDLNTFLSPEALAEQYWQLHMQDKTVWTQELDVRPFIEKF